MIKEDYPKNFEKFIVRFSTEEACYDYIASLRWPEGYKCPRCNNSKAWKSQRNLLCCSNCGHQASITAGTLFQGTRKPLRLWFHVMWWIMSQKSGASAKNLQHTMGFNRYETAWTWLHKFRRVMIRPGRDRLNGHVEVDETFIGGAEKGIRGRKAIKKALVIIAVEIEKKTWKTSFSADSRCFCRESYFFYKKQCKTRKRCCDRWLERVFLHTECRVQPCCKKHCK